MDRSEQALRERLELAKKATPGPWKESVQIVNGDAVSAVSTACGDEICNTYGNLLCDTFDAAHISASSPEVVQADLEEILALRAEVARLRARVRWLSKCAFKDTNRCAKLPGFSRCVWNCGEWCGAADDLRKGCWRDAADMATRENPGRSGEVPENPGEGKTK